MIKPEFEKIMAHADTRFTAVVVAARRARQIAAYFGQLGAGIGEFAPPTVITATRKPLSIALEELAQGRLGYERPAPSQAREMVPSLAAQALLGRGKVEGEPAEGRGGV